MSGPFSNLTCYDCGKDSPTYCFSHRVIESPKDATYKIMQYKSVVVCPECRDKFEIKGQQESGYY